MNWAVWQGATSCTGPMPGARALWQWIEQNHPGLYSFGGIYNCRPVRGGRGTSTHSEGRALDAMIRPVAGRGDPRGYRLLEQLGPQGRSLGLQAWIWDRKIWAARSPNSRAYTGVHPHYDHHHIELTREAGRTLTVERIRQVVGGVAPPAPSGRRVLRLTSPMMRGADVAQWQAAIGANPDGLFGPATRERTIVWQRSKGLAADGIVGPRSWQAAGF